MSEVAEARPSSTVVLARDAEGAPELLMMRRHERSSFGGAYAFPGGVLEAGDGEVTANCSGLSTDAASQLLGDTDAISYFSAAIRELFEESGVLLADFDAGKFHLDAARDALNAGDLGWQDFVLGNNVQLRCDALNYFSFWITPEALPKRYSTRFFLAAMPDGQTALHCGGELTESCWVTARDALDAQASGSMSMHFPTIKTLESLAEHATLDALLDWAAGRASDGVPCIFPVIGGRDGQRRVLVEGEDAGALE